jgi:hypothetical protein
MSIAIVRGEYSTEIESSLHVSLLISPIQPRRHLCLSGTSDNRMNERTTQSFDCLNENIVNNSSALLFAEFILTFDCTRTTSRIVNARNEIVNSQLYCCIYEMMSASIIASSKATEESGQSN